MKRLAIIALAVLVPFAALVGWGLSTLSDEPLPLPPPQAEPAPPPAPPIAERPRPEPAPAPVPVPVPPPEPPAPAAAIDDAAAELAKMEPKQALLHELTPLVNLCFLDLDGRFKQVIHVAASFDPQADGTVTNVRLKMKSADPYLTACVQDALEGARISLPQGMPQGSIRHTFIFNPHAKQ